MAESLREEESRKAKALQVDYHQTFGNEQGQRVLKDLNARFFENESTFNPHMTANPELTFVNEGGRMVMLTIKNIMSLSVEELVQRRIA